MTSMLKHITSEIPSGLPLVDGFHQPGLVVLSILVAVAMSLLALQTSYVAHTASSSIHKRVALLTGACALGIGIWAMHFIGMLAFQLPAPVSYHTGLTLASMIPAVVASWLALQHLSRSGNKSHAIGVSGTLVGGGIGLMHYVGMAALETPLHMHHDPLLFGLSIVAAVALAILALWIRLGLRKTRLSATLRYYLAGSIMGLAIVSMHYIAMHGVRFYGDASALSDGIWVNNSYLALALSSVVLTLGIVVASLNGLVRMRELHRSANSTQSRMQAIVDTAVDAIITIDGLGTIRDFNLSAERLFGYDAREVLNQNVKMLMPEPYHSEHDGYLQRYQTTGETRIIGKGREAKARHKDGRVFPIRLSVGKVELDNREPLFVGLIADISERVQLEQSLREAAKRAEQAAQAKGQFLANMSHEIRTPMNSIIGFTEILLQGQLDPVQRGHLSTIRQSSRTLLGLINDILDTTKLENHRLQLENSDFSLRAVVMQVESSLRIQAQNKGLEFMTRYADDMPEYFVGDTLRLVQVLTNLVGNAIKFTEQGAVQLALRYVHEQVEIIIKDTGIGMTSEQVSTIFEPFTQADASISRRFGGTGLGTTIARQLVEAMDGRIEVSSEPGLGSEFRLYLPLPQGQAPQSDEPAASIDLPPLRILIADDVEQNLRLLRLVLEKNGHQVEQAENGARVLELYAPGRFDVLLLDLHMPVVDGLQAAQRIRELEQQQGISSPVPVIALTASVMQGDRDAAQQAGMNGFASKPLDVPALFAEIARVTGQGASTPPAATQTGTNQLIDWQQGIALWGSKDQLQHEIQLFLDDWQSRYPLHYSPGSDLQPLIFSLHGIRGAAGNLALGAAASLAGKLEQQLRTHNSDGLDASLARLQQLMADSAREAGHPAAAQPAPAAPVPDAGLQHCLEPLREVLRSHQLDDDLLASVLAALQNGPARHIETACKLGTAVDNFDFDQALALLESLEPDIAPPGDLLP